MEGTNGNVDKLKQQMADLQARVDQYFDLGFGPDRRHWSITLLEVIAVLGGLAAVYSILDTGIGFVSGAFVAAGLWVLHSEKQRRSSRDFFRDEYRKADAQLERLKDEIKGLSIDLHAAEADFLKFVKDQ